jgi:hypothetical protein
MSLPAYEIFNEKTSPQVLISKRTILPPGVTVLQSEEEPGSVTKTSIEDKKLNQQSELLATMTTTGTSLTLAGFICQNFGIRQLHWSAGVAQLISTLLLVFLRALLRYHLGDAPKKRIRLREGFEASHLASYIHQVERLMIPVGVLDSKGYIPPQMLPDNRRTDFADLPQLSSEALIIYPFYETRPDLNSIPTATIGQDPGAKALSLANKLLWSQMSFRYHNQIPK